MPLPRPQTAPSDSVQAAAEPMTLAELAGDLRATLGDPALWMDLLGTLFQIVLIAALAVGLLRLIDRAIAHWRERVEDLPVLDPRRQRILTSSNLLRSAARYVIWPIAAIMILSELNVDVGALVATAGIAGLALGFGAQTLVQDVISGIFLLFDDTIHVGDLVRIGNDTGTVEEIGVRLIRVRKFDGELLMVPAGELRVFGNKSIAFARVVVPVGLSYEQDVDTVLPVMQRVADAWAETAEADLLPDEPPTVQALMDFGDSAVTARIVAKVKPGTQFDAERDLRLRLKRAFDARGIEIPFPRRTLYVRQEQDLPPASISNPEAAGPEASD